MNKISIITINYNNLEGLRKTMQSVVQQTNKFFEYIVIDGGSTDGSADYIAENAKNIDYLISEKDTGIYNAMNKGIKKATGEYLLFLNSGDCFADNNVLEHTLPYLTTQHSFVYGNMFLSKNDVRISKLITPTKLDFSYFVTNSLPHPATFIKRQLFYTYFLYNEALKIVADWEFFIYCICKQNESYQHINITISDFDNNGLSSLKDNKQKIIAEEDKVFENHFPMFLSEVNWVRNIKTKRLQQLNYVATQKIRWKFLKAILSTFVNTKEVNYTKPVFTKLS